MRTGIIATMEWAWKLKSERLLNSAEQVGLFRNVPRYRGQDIQSMLMYALRIWE